jgi:hypothetical protein
MSDEGKEISTLQLWGWGGTKSTITAAIFLAYCTSPWQWMVMIVERLVKWIIIRGNRSTRRKPAPVPFYPPQIPHDMTRARTRAVVLVNMGLTPELRHGHNQLVVHRRWFCGLRLFLVREVPGSRILIQTVPRWLLFPIRFLGKLDSTVIQRGLQETRNTRALRSWKSERISKMCKAENELDELRTRLKRHRTLGRMGNCTLNLMRMCGVFWRSRGKQNGEVLVTTPK